ncbi:hypothetical protein F2Q69_00055668 [Brassica cretica]|uniref:Uncharacterized protein n=1 Tax=Brassica cretica TaxID=69181 RepID=A0A8S9N653_BRACR|nr:hypothetical protein F2Q69_00055668 [Brassica cretica]
MEDAIAAASATVEAAAANRSGGGCDGYGGGGYGDGKREGRYKRLVDTMVVDVVIRKVDLVVVRWRWLWIPEWRLWWLWIRRWYRG